MTNYGTVRDSLQTKGTSPQPSEYSEPNLGEVHPVKNQSAKIKMARMKHRLEASFAEMHAYQLNHETIPQLLIKTTLTNISNLLEANRQLQAVAYVDNVNLDKDEEYTDILTDEQLLTISQLHISLLNLEALEPQKGRRGARRGHG